MAIRLGVITDLNENLDEKLAKIAEMGLPTCQISTWKPELWTDEMADIIVESSARHKVEVTSLWAGYAGPAAWNFIDGPSTLGFVPPDYREMRVESMMKAIAFAKRIGTPSISTHAGFIPECPKDPWYEGTIEALRRVAVACEENGLGFWFETGQETPVTLHRAIKDIGTSNLGVNLDPANLLLYGRANPVDALDILGPYVKGVHAKDGDYPTDPNKLGREYPLGEGKVNFPVFVPKLKSFGFDGAITIEREISGPKQIEDIQRAVALLTPLL